MFRQVVFCVCKSVEFKKLFAFIVPTKQVKAKMYN